MEIYFPMNSWLNTFIHKRCLHVLIDLLKEPEETRHFMSIRMWRET